ncbi:MAG TPA: ABC transporter permease [Anaerolineaceae bacterium]|nr:ABC transporter permease [Anaerolineaceae bacterium]
MNLNNPTLNGSIEGQVAPSLPVTHIRPPSPWPSLRIGEVWEYRDLLFILAWRDIKVRYKQTTLGAAWAVLQPILTMVVFSLLFGGIAHLPSEGIPYPIFTFTALLPWQLFAYAMTESGNSLVANQQLITKVYFPRLVIPLGGVLAGLVDFTIAFLVLLGMMLIYGVPLSWNILALPAFIFLAVLIALTVGIWLSALNVEYRDVRYTIPFLTQFWMFATPIAYSSSLIPENLRWLYSLNPMVGVVEGFRWAVLGRQGFSLPFFLLSIGVMLVLFAGGVAYFRKMENGFADNV